MIPRSSVNLEAKALFPQEASQFDSHHSFIVRYTATEDLGLDMHTDDSATGHDGWLIFGTVKL